MREAVILAGGFGTRLSRVVHKVPKPMAPIQGKPFLSYVLRYLQNNGVQKAVMSVGYLHQHIIDYYGDSFEGMALSYAIESRPLGTGGAIRYALEQIEGQECFVVNGDTLFDVPLDDLKQKHQAHGSSFSLALRQVDNIARYGAVKTNERQQVTAFMEKGHASGKGFINGGIYLMECDFFEKINIFTDVFSLENDIFEKYVSKGIFYGFEYDSYFIDIGIPEDYNTANQQLKNKYHE